MQGAVLAAAIGVLGTGLGGAMYLKKEANRAKIGLVAAGIMLAIASMELLPEAIALAGVQGGFWGFAAGVTGMVGLIVIFSKKFLPGGWMLLLSLALHNLPEGLAIGAGFMAAPELGLGTALAVGSHVIPEGMALGVLLRQDGKSRTVSSLLAALAGAPMALGALAGQTLAVTAGGLGFVLSMAAGVMVYTAAAEMLPVGYAKKTRPQLSGMWLALGFVLMLAGEILAG